MGRKSTLFVVLGVLLLLAATGVAAMSLAPSGNSLLSTANPQEEVVEQSVPVVIAQLDLPKGTLIDTPEELLSISEVPLSQFNDQTQFNDVEALRDMVTTADIKAGDALRKSAVREAGLSQKIPASAPGEPALKAFPIQANSLSGVGDLMQPGDFVDVLGSFRVDVTTMYNNGQGVSEKTSEEGTTKMLLQDVEVLDVLKPTVPAEGEAAAEPTPAPETTEGGDNISGESTSANELVPGNWIIVLAVTDEEAEILRFTLNQGFNLTTVLRRAGDHAASETTGTTMQVLIDTYGLPMPRGLEIEQRSNLSNAPASFNNQ